MNFLMEVYRKLRTYPAYKFHIPTATRHGHGARAIFWCWSCLLLLYARCGAHTKNDEA